MGVAGGFEILGAFAGRFSCMELSEIEEACAKIGIQIQGKELIDKISDLKNSGHLKEV
jgi:phage-related holin